MFIDEEIEAKVCAARTPKQKLALALDAIGYVLLRVERDADFRWHMSGTEASAKLLCAYAALTERDIKEVNAKHEQRTTDEKSTHQKLNELRDALLEMDMRSAAHSPGEALRQIESLRKQAEAI